LCHQSLIKRVFYTASKKKHDMAVNIGWNAFVTTTNKPAKVHFERTEATAGFSAIARIESPAACRSRISVSCTGRGGQHPCLP
jgi:hypothetical protein